MRKLIIKYHKDKELNLNKIKDYLEKNPKINIAFALLFVSTIIIMGQIQDNISEIRIDDLKIITNNSFIIFGTIVVLSILIYTIVDLLFDRSDHAVLSKQLDDKLKVVQEMLETKGLQTIVTNDDIEKEEEKADEIKLIVENLNHDINNGKYFDEVHKNIKEGKQYTYYLKYDIDTHSQIEAHNNAHYEKIKERQNVKEPIFVLIPANEYSFFSDIYIYYGRNGSKYLSKKAFELLPNLTRFDAYGEETLFYLEFSKEQTDKLNNILHKINQQYGVTLASTLEKNKEYIVNQSRIDEIEKNATQITIITDSLKDDLKDGYFHGTVNSNIRSGEKDYTYYVPDTKNIIEEIKQFNLDHELDGNEKVYFVKIPINSFLFYSNIYIYNNEIAFEYLPSTNQYFEYSQHQCKKIQESLDKLK
jgi:hypothetical protein